MTPHLCEGTHTNVPAFTITASPPTRVHTHTPLTHVTYITTHTLDAKSASN